MGWLIGTLRIVPAAEPGAFGWTLFPNPFFGGVLWPGLVFLFLYLWPAVERRLTGDRDYHHMLDRPRDNPLRTAVGWALLATVAVGLFAGTSDRVMVQAGIDYQAQIWFYRGAFFAAPALAFAIALRVCRELREHEYRPAIGEEGAAPVRKPEETPAGG